MTEIGKTLREAREEKNLSLKDVENNINVRSSYLQALEEENFEAIPGEVYLKGFLKTYGNFLGLDGDEIVSMYKAAKQPETVLPNIPEMTPKKATKRKLNVRKLVMLVAALIVVIVVVAALSGTFPGDLNKHAKPSPTEVTPPAKNAPATPRAQTPAQVPGVHIKAVFKDSCWARVSVDGKIVYEGIPAVGQTLSFDGTSKIGLKLGNAGAVDIYYNNQPQAPLGAAGEVKEKEFVAS